MENITAEDLYESMMDAVQVTLPYLDEEDYTELGDEIFLRVQKLLRQWTSTPTKSNF